MEIRLLKKIICPDCGHCNTRYRIKTNELVCLTCGCVWENEKFQDRVKI